MRARSYSLCSSCRGWATTPPGWLQSGSPSRNALLGNVSNCSIFGATGSFLFRKNQGQFCFECRCGLQLTCSRPSWVNGINSLRGASDSISETLNPRKLSHTGTEPALSCWPVIRKLISLLPLRGVLDAHQDLIECRTIKKLAVRDNDGDFPSIPDVFERVCAQQHQIGDLAGFD